MTTARVNYIIAKPVEQESISTDNLQKIQNDVENTYPELLHNEFDFYMHEPINKENATLPDPSDIINIPSYDNTTESVMLEQIMNSGIPKEEQNRLIEKMKKTFIEEINFTLLFLFASKSEDTIKRLSNFITSSKLLSLTEQNEFLRQINNEDNYKQTE